LLTVLLTVPPSQHTRLSEHPIGAAGADGNDIFIEHHKGQPTVAFQWIACLVIEDGFFLPGLEPVITGHGGIMLVVATIAPLPVIELRAAQSQPVYNLQGAQSGFLAAPVVYKINHSRQVEACKFTLAGRVFSVMVCLVYLGFL